MQKIVITGGTGFVGRSICEHLAAQDAACRLVVPTRRLANGKHVQVLPTVDLVQADVHDPQAMAQLLQGADALVHLVANLHGDDDAFDRVHVQLPRSLAAACAPGRRAAGGACQRTGRGAAGAIVVPAQQGRRGRSVAAGAGGRL